MKSRRRKFSEIFVYVLLTAFAAAETANLRTGSIRIRDPFIYADASNKTYYMYAQSANRAGSGYQGVEVYASTDLKAWTAPETVLTIPGNWNIRSVWAPEMHEYNGDYYLFVTLSFEDQLPGPPPVEGNWPQMSRRGTFVFHSDSPLGPFRPFKTESHTPENWMALDGTLYVEGGIPYMIFCHEWVQMIDGAVDCIQMTEDLSDTIGAPQILFKASDVPTAVHPEFSGKITDGCFLYKSQQSARLFMIWSTFIPGRGYCEILSCSETGKITGPWHYQKVLYDRNGGHGMIFETFEGQLVMALHQPNDPPRERMKLFKISDRGDTLDFGGILD
ncbi:MAG: glycoside hydrolase family 43 protein [Kiritimatiellales bacterium]